MKSYKTKQENQHYAQGYVVSINQKHKKFYENTLSVLAMTDIFARNQLNKLA